MYIQDMFPFTTVQPCSLNANENTRSGFVTWNLARFTHTYTAVIFHVWELDTHRSPFGLRFWSGTFPLGLLSLPAQGPPPGPVTRRDSRPLEDFLYVNSTCSPSFKLRKPSITSLLCREKKKKKQLPIWMWQVLLAQRNTQGSIFKFITLNCSHLKI